MSFQPFGYRFEIKSPSPPSDVKATIRSRKKGWLDPKTGARGWIIGPFICLWFSAFDRQGPMLFGLITHDSFGTRVHGRAGSDLNGVLMFSLLLPLMAFLTIQMISDGSASPRQLIVYGLIFLVGGPLLYWWAHKDRRAAEPLIRFLSDSLTPKGEALRAQSRRAAVPPAFTLSVSGEEVPGPVTSEAIHDALLGLGAHDFVVLASGPETYMQTAFKNGGYILETREGNAQRHFQAARGGTVLAKPGDVENVLSFNEVREAFMAYASASPMPHFLKWQPMGVEG